MHEIHWRPTIGDPSVMGWVTVGAYLLVAWLCLMAFNVEKRGRPRPLRQSIPAAFRVLWKHWPHPPLPLKRALVWLTLAGILGVLAVNKQIDLQTLFTQIGRVVAERGGWYAQRAIVQKAFIATIAGLALLVSGWLWWITRSQMRDLRVPLLGFAFILAFVVVRASSFHHVDALIGFEWFGIRMNWVLELGGIAVVGVGAARRLRRLELSGADYAEGARASSSRSGR